MTDYTVQNVINRVSDAYDPNSRRQQECLAFLAEFVDAEDSINYVEALMGVGNEQVENVACIVLSKCVENNWDGLNPGMKEGMRSFIINNLQSHSNVINSQLSNILANIAIKDFPEKWPAFFEDILSAPAGNFGVLANFLLQVTDSDSTKITPAKLKQIHDKMLGFKKPIISACIDAVPSNDAKRALDAFLPYIKWEDVDIAKFNSLGQNQDPQVFALLCTLICIDGCTPEIIKMVFPHLCSMIENLPSEEVFNSICPVLIKHAKVLEVEQLANVRGVLNKIAELDFQTHLDFWENFILGVFETYKTESRLDRFTLYQELFGHLRDYVLRNMPQPPGFILPGEGDTSLDENAMLEYSQFRNIFVAILTMEPEKVMPAVAGIFNELNSVFKPKLFLSVIWSIACITGATGSVVEGHFVVESLQFILQAFKNSKLTKEIHSVVAACFLYLVAAYAKAQKLTPQFISIALNLATTGLVSENLRKMSANTILAIGSNCASLVTNLPDLTDLIMNNVILAPDVYTDVCEGFGKIYHAKSKLSKLVDMALERWTATKDFQNNKDVVVHTHFVLAILLGFAKADPGYISKIVSRMIEDLTILLTDFETHLTPLHDLSGHDEEKEMYAFCRTATILFKTAGIKQCKPILSIYANSAPSIRQIEALQLAEALLKLELKPEEAQEIHQLIIDPTKQMIADDDFPEPTFQYLIPGVINAYIQGYFQISLEGDPCNLETDMGFLLDLVQCQDQTAITSAINAIENTVTKADMNLREGDRQGFFRSFLLPVMSTMMFIATEPSHKFCLDTIFRYIIKLFVFISAERVQVSLFDDTDNIKGTINVLASMLCERIPIISLQNMKICIQLLLEANTKEDYEHVLIEFISEARMTVPSETLRHIMLKKVKSCIEQE